MEFEQIRFEVSDEVATLTLNRPEARNALSIPMRRDLDAALAILKAEAGTTIKALVLTGAGGAFCAGGDVKAMHERRGENSTYASRGRLREAHNRLTDLMNLEMPVIVAVDGAAAGAGFNLALAGDFILASDRAFFIQSFVRIGLVPDWNGLFLLPRLVGLQRAKEIMFTGRRIRAEEACRLGIVHSVHPQAQLMGAAMAMARRFCRAPTNAIGLSKNILNQSFHLDARTILELEAYAQATARGGEYHRAAVERFVTRQPSLFDWDAMDKDQPVAGDPSPGQ
ncbi:MAG: enoyl-CoA hydratase/isomerase family protein [Burkholderiaceae bacterium]|jgi:2-(1,2-epoxy-1,2-dihydrophenyl)acetyl-CoA isomerase|nr:enoyl-CoA hydratase/isomerase family protein [Gemmatimonadales bacterium]MCO5118749.1 enoyl-CoA hydratase/isomerase family protein [Burkholderiaceae bacterium]MEB2319938.1 enoyl-CoA hydratase/isomerase family protein [Pseudomonadota bacterium]